MSKLDPSIYGSEESALKEEHIIDHIDGMSIQQVQKNGSLTFRSSSIEVTIHNMFSAFKFQALEENKLFILDYHDLYLPFLDRINGLDERKAYATTTIFFLTKMGTLKPITIQLALPTSKQVLTLPVDANSKWLWQLGKAHVCSNDASVHTLVHHWYEILFPHKQQY